MSDPDLMGSHTQKKLGVISGYLNFYSNALKNKNFELVYIDAFAGTGVLSSSKGDVSKDDLFYQETLDSHPNNERPGSAKLALSVQPPIERIILIEKNTNRAKRLTNLKQEFPERSIEIYNDDANASLIEICKNIDWKSKNTDRYGVRAVVFLDPYGMQLNWSTLEAIRNTEAIDLWYLFPTHGVLRQATRDSTKITGDKEAALNRLFGNNRWKDALYEEKPISGTKDLFSQSKMTKTVRNANAKDVEIFFRERLMELFPFVHPNPLQLENCTAHDFSLFFAASNPSKPAINLAKKGADILLNNARIQGIRSMSALYNCAQ